MKFGKYFEEQRHAEYEGKYFPYSAVKQQLKRTALNSVTLLLRKSSIDESVNDFATTFKTNVATVSEVVLERYSSFQKQYTQVKEHSQKWAADSAHDESAVERQSEIKAQIERLHQKLFLFSDNYIRLNILSIHSVIKKGRKYFPDLPLWGELDSFSQSQLYHRQNDELKELLMSLRTLYSSIFSGNDDARAALDLMAASTHAVQVPLKSIRDKNGFIIDMDGTIYKDGQLIPGAREFVLWLRRSNKKFLFLTNASDKTQYDLRIRLKSMGIEVQESHFWTSALATAHWLATQSPRGSAFVIGSQGLYSALYHVGFSITENNPDYVILGETSDTYNFSAVQKAIELIMKGARFLVTNDDVYDASKNGRIPSCGALKTPIEMVTGVKAFSVGKPSPLMMRHAIKMLDMPSRDVVIVGDRMDTDILSGCQAGVSTCLVLSGVTNRSDLAKFAFKPDYIMNSVESIPDFIESDE